MYLAIMCLRVPQKGSISQTLPCFGSLGTFENCQLSLLWHVPWGFVQDSPHSWTGDSDQGKETSEVKMLSHHIIGKVYLRFYHCCCKSLQAERSVYQASHGGPSSLPCYQCLSVRASHAACLQGVNSSLPSMSVDSISDGSFFCVRESCLSLPRSLFNCLCIDLWIWFYTSC